MNNRKLKKDFRAATNTVIIVLIAILMLSASSVVVLLYTGTQSNEGISGTTVQVGDTIRVDYIGRLVDGRVFDTSLYSVAVNDAMYPKSLMFTMRPESSYTPLQFTVGSGQLITGFDRGVIGMQVGQTKVIEVPPSLGYGLMNESKLVYMPLLETMPVYINMNSSRFSAEYGASPQVGMTVSDPKYGWDVNVIQVDPKVDLVVVMNMPTVGHKYAVYGDPEAQKPSGWYAEVEAIDSSANAGNGIIEVLNLLSDSDAGYVKGVDASGSNTFIVDKVSTTSNEFRMNYNGELVGVTLYFTVTVLSIVQ